MRQHVVRRPLIAAGRALQLRWCQAVGQRGKACWRFREQAQDLFNRK
jgi:hypothetical protein